MNACDVGAGFPLCRELMSILPINSPRCKGLLDLNTLFHANLRLSDSKARSGYLSRAIYAPFYAQSLSLLTPLKVRNEIVS